LEAVPDPAVVTDANLRAAIVASGFAWRIKDTSSNIEMLLVPGGTFTMGCSASTQFGCSSGESPTHQVTLTQAFYMGRHEVTQAQWQATMGSNPSSFQGQSDSPSRPVENVSWNTIQGFNTSTGLRLPTEAEWEYACRAATTTARYGELNAIAWYYQNWTIYGTQPVAGKLPNALGLYDTLGNVWEWCQDGFGLYSSASVTNPTGSATSSQRLWRSGSFNNNSDSCRASVRNASTPDGFYGSLGFRAARTP
jgi:formylglycine-generating enzyme required for sulfatase activity